MKYALAAALLLPLLASANDSVGGLSGGGIVLRKTDAIAMKKEVLSVSTRLITVDYDFVNESGKDVDETIVFPLPVYSAAQQPSDTYYGQPARFSIEVDGKSVNFRTVVQAMVDNVDVTPQLRKVGLSDAQIVYHQSFGRQANVPPLTAKQHEQLARLRLMNDRTGEMDYAWDVHVSYVWQQRFPANKVVHVRHTYRPFVTSGPGEWIMNDETRKTYCTDPAFLKTWNKLAQGEGDYRFVPADKVSYILRSGNSWKRGIEDFTLNIVKSDPKEIISLCFPGTFKKIDANTYQVQLRDFKPTDDLDVYFGNVKDSAAGSDGQMPVLAK